MLDEDRQQLAAIQEESLSALGGVLRTADLGRRVALLDYPRHRNAGDTMIWAGELAYLRTLGIDVGYTADMRGFDLRELERRVPYGPVLLHGGGNFGDLWPAFQSFREALLRQLPDRHVVLLPQTIYFRSASNAARVNAELAEHGQVHLLLRDRASLARASQHLPDVPVSYCPDMAFGIGPLRRVGQPAVDVLRLLRDDAERAFTVPPVAARSSMTADWRLRRTRRVRWATARLWSDVAKRLPPTGKGLLARPLARSYRTMTDLNLGAAVELCSSGRVVVTDRLHAHVLCTLMSIPHVVIDNSYGKVRSIYEDYSGRFSTGVFAARVDEVPELVLQRLSEHESPPPA